MVMNWACLGYNFYIHALISLKFGTVVHLKHLFSQVEGQGHT